MTRVNDEGADIDDTCRTVRAEYDWASVTPSTAVTETIAEVSDCDPTAIVPLYRFVDPDALDQLVGPRPTGIENVDTVVAFEFGTYHVTVSSDGLVMVAPVQEVDASERHH